MGQIVSLGGQAAAGSFGAPVIVASVFNQNVTTTAQVTLVSMSVPAGVYRFSGWLSVNNGTQPQKIKFQFNGNSLPIFTSATGVVVLDGVNDSLFNSFYVSWPLVSDYSATTLTVTYQDPGGTPNDNVSVIVERLA